VANKLGQWTAFTDGTHTWIDGPLGPQTRGNNERFAWEPNPDRLPVNPPPHEGKRCRTSGLSLAPTGITDAAVGHAGAYFSFTNLAGVRCVLQGYVGVELLEAHANPAPTRVSRGGGYLFADRGPEPVMVAPGGSAVFAIEWVQVPSVGEDTCSTATLLAITPPHEDAPLATPAMVSACSGGHVRVTAVQPQLPD
jgi:Protein of unknown function (DUF4232)